MKTQKPRCSQVYTVNEQIFIGIYYVLGMMLVSKNRARAGTKALEFQLSCPVLAHRASLPNE